MKMNALELKGDLKHDPCPKDHHITSGLLYKMPHLATSVSHILAYKSDLKFWNLMLHLGAVIFFF